ncbi:T-cell surface glycoprotein CD8 alpha chain [Pseudoliparis swirei]|uniref:T-cell surface glycoprotein CD8 alpha chain n=1 Tax=Pseudoliparis swirei TaxID=2059687 RepID=UPI0024BDFC10|nr:T-cell surface glycoprotein CD8 alpha chain [Pseudoliparis swirei]
MKVPQWILVTLVFCQNVPPGAGEVKRVKDGEPVDLTCAPVPGSSLVVQFRLLDTGMEFIASFSKDGFLKLSSDAFKSTFSDLRRDGNLRLRSFNRTRDSGVYGCAALVGNKLEFGKVVRLVGGPVEVAVEAPQNPAAPTRCSTVAPCVCTNEENIERGGTGPRMVCSPIVLGALAAGCGLLLLLLIVSTLYCNHIRTRRCPHHYKRKPRPTAGKQMMTDSHV